MPQLTGLTGLEEMQDYMSIEDASKTFKYNAEYLRRLCRDKKIIYYRIRNRRKLMINTKSLLRHMNETERAYR